METETPSADSASARPATGRTLAVIFASALLGALVGGGLVFLTLINPSASRSPRLDSNALDGPSTSAARERQGAAGERSSPLATAKQLAASGRLREAQEEYLSILLVDPTHEEAMRGLVRVVGLIAKGDRTALLRQAEEYRRAVALGTETEEHYTGPAMEILARATVQAAGGRLQPGRETRVAQPPAATTPPSPAVTPAERRSREPSKAPPPAPSPGTQPKPAGGTSAPVASPPTVPRTPDATPSDATETTADTGGPPARLQIGPVSSPVASEILGELTIAGFTARVSSQGGLQVFRVLSNRLPAGMASRRARELTATGFPARVRPLSGGFAQLDLGAYPTAEGAEVVAGKVRANGVDASVVPEGGPSRLITVGPHSRAMIDEITRLMRAKFRTVRLVVVRAE